MKMSVNPFAKAIRQKQKQIGLWISISSPFAAEVTAPAGFDWALIDMEHAPNDYFSVLGQLQAFSSTKTTTIVRPEWNDPVAVKRLMELGVGGLLFPMIGSVEEAEKAVASTRYPPNGIRGFSGSTRANRFGRVTDYLDRVDEETVVIVQLETLDAMSRAVEIAAVDGVDGVFFGPGDIAADMGRLGKPLHDDVWAQIRPVAQKLIDAGVAVGTLVNDADLGASLLNAGFTFVACGTDTILLSKATDALLADVKSQIT